MTATSQYLEQPLRTEAEYWAAKDAQRALELHNLIRSASPPMDDAQRKVWEGLNERFSTKPSAILPDVWKENR